MANEPKTLKDKRACACNYAIATRFAALGALCYVLNSNPGWGGERIEVLVFSRGGKWIRRWEASWRLHNFRLKTIPASKQSVYDRVEDFAHWDADRVRWFNEARDKDRGKQLANLAGLTQGSV